ncbi:MAG: hypothetical protein AB1599_05715 [Planctomycetota bacterium]
MQVDKSLFIGKTVTKIELDKETQEWVFDFSNDINLRVSTPWRIINDKEILRTSGDEGQIYGLPEPVNVGKNVMDLLKGKKITNFNADPITTDLTFEFDGNLKIQTFNDSGYEPWIIWSKNGVEYVSSGCKIYHSS